MSIFSTPGREGDARLLTLENPAFISDLHLTRDAPDTLAGFFRFMEGPALDYAELVILGDFFNYWIGDDASFTVAEVTRALKTYSDTGRRLFLMQGNRDFLMGADYARECGATLLADPVAADVNGTRLLLSHGDMWCTNDPGYQKVRARLRSRWWQWCALRLSLKKRLSIAENARRKSRAEKVTKSREITDVVPAAYREALSLTGATIVIHGHTHRPAVHEDEGGIVRAVLPDWAFEGERCLRGGWLAICDGRPTAFGPEYL